MSEDIIMCRQKDICYYLVKIQTSKLTLEFFFWGAQVRFARLRAVLKIFLKKLVYSRELSNHLEKPTKYNYHFRRARLMSRKYRVAKSVPWWSVTAGRDGSMMPMMTQMIVRHSQLEKKCFHE